MRRELSSGETGKVVKLLESMRLEKIRSKVPSPSGIWQKWIRRTERSAATVKPLIGVSVEFLCWEVSKQNLLLKTLHHCS